jgi:HPt (histidine-containing phosphotransfer) domain-containing protein
MTSINRAGSSPRFGNRLLRRIRHLILPSGGSSSRRTTSAPAVTDADLRVQSLGQRFSGELQSRLLKELPGYRQEIACAHERGDSAAMRKVVHRLLGAAVYCDLGTLEDDLRDLQLALKTQDRFTIETAYARLAATLDALAIRPGNQVADRD